jgi:hypothetical protein
MTLRWADVGVAVLLILGTCIPLSLASAQPAARCETCVVSYGCENTRASCIAECRARLFSVDPKRSECIEACARKAAECTRTADTSCKTQKAC